VAQRFLRYVRYDTQSDPVSAAYPSTEKQKVLLGLLREELIGLGLADAAMEGYGYVTATLPSNVRNRVPVIGLIAHVDTSPDVSGARVNALVHADYQGQPIQLNNKTLTHELAPRLGEHIGHTIITSDGSTLLGADDKSGIAEIMTCLEVLKTDASIPHGELKIAFTPDEEVGNGTKFFDVRRFGADYAYTVDGGPAGEIDNETFCADSAVVVFTGVNVHPGLAKGKLASAIKAASLFVDLLPHHLSPEETDGKLGYLHPTSVAGSVETVTVNLILRDFEEAQLKAQQAILEDIRKVVALAFPRVQIGISIEESYRNLRSVLDKYPFVVDNAVEAIRRCGLQPALKAIRGGTDGSRLSYLGLPTPNLFTGGNLAHSYYEWVCVEDMDKAVQTLCHLVQIWVEKSQ
jgi:tripeptide aminopeptidase